MPTTSDISVCVCVCVCVCVNLAVSQVWRIACSGFLGSEESGASTWTRPSRGGNDSGREMEGKEEEEEEVGGGGREEALRR